MGKYLHQITELSETPANGDLILVQDISDTTDSKNGTTKRVTYSNLTSGLGGGSGLSNIVEDTTPQLGGSLDVNGKSIVSTSGANITIAPNGVGNVILGTMSFDADQSIGAGQDNYVLTYDNSTGLISLEVAAGGGSGDITAVNITTDSGAGSKASDTSGDADFSLLGGDGISVTNSGATITVALADPDSDDGSDIDEGVIATNDRLLIWDETANNWKYVTVDNLQDEIDTNTGISNVVEDTSPQLGGQLDVNGQAIGDGTRELLTFTEDGSAVNHINIENQATGGGPIISTAGDDSDVDLILSPKGTGNVTIAARTVINGTAPLGTLTVYGDNASDQAFVLKAAAGQAGRAGYLQGRHQAEHHHLRARPGGPDRGARGARDDGRRHAAAPAARRGAAAADRDRRGDRDRRDDRHQGVRLPRQPRDGVRGPRRHHLRRRQGGRRRARALVPRRPRQEVQTAT